MRGAVQRFMPSYLWGHFLIRGYDVRMLLESASWVLTAKKMAAGSAAMEEYENILGPSKFGDS